MANGYRLRKFRYNVANQFYCVTTCTSNRHPIFRHFSNAREVVSAIKFQDDHDRTKTIAFVIMPDHIHWLFELKSGELSAVVHSVKRYVANQLGGRVWQHGYYEHTVRKEEDLKKLSRYIVANPLRAGLVDDILDYPHWDAIWLTGGEKL